MIARNKYLPVGSVVLFGGKNVLITGYNYVTYKNGTIFNDYVGFVYPEGMLDGNMIAFNHDQIDELLFVGLENTDYQLLNADLQKYVLTTALNTNVAGDIGVVPTFSNNSLPNKKTVIANGVEFDENGYVIRVLDEVNDNPFMTPEVPLNNTYQFDKDGNVISEGVMQTPPMYEFDKDGNVISDASTPVTEIMNNNIQSTPEAEYKFDKDGNVIEDSSIPPIPTATESGDAPTTSYKFDKDGNVIEDNAFVPPIPVSVEQENTGSSTLEFDKDGNVISE